MIRAVSEKYCKDNLVQLMPYIDQCQLIMDTDEILFLKIGNRILVNKYENHQSRHLFPYSDNIKYRNGFESYYNQLFEYNKIYLNFRSYRFDKMYFFKGTNRALFLKEGLEVDDRKKNDSIEYLTRDEIEKIFDSKNYDSMYVINENGSVLFAKSKKDGNVISKKLIPSNEEIIEIDRQKKESDLFFAKIFNESAYNDKLKEVNAKKSIEDIHEICLYGPILLNNYTHFLVTSLNGKFEMKWFKLDFVSKNKFRLTTSNIPVIEPTIDDVIAYSRSNKIKNINEPFFLRKNENVEKVASKIPKETSCKIINGEDDATTDNKKYSNGAVKKILKRTKKKDTRK